MSYNKSYIRHWRNYKKRLCLNRCDDLTSEIFDLLISSPSLENLFVTSIRLAIDDSLSKAANLQQFRNPKRLQLHDVDVSEEGVDLFLNDNNPLKSVSLQLNLEEESSYKWLR